MPDERVLWATRIFESMFPPMPFAGVKLDRRGVLLLIEVMPGDVVAWLALGPRGAELSSEGVIWANGRLTDSGGGLRKLYEWLARMGATFGEVELELRRVTNYREDGGGG